MSRRDPARNARRAASQKSAADLAPDSLNRPSGFVWPALACAAIILAGLAAYSDSFHGPFIFDDNFYVNVPTAVKLWPIWPTLVGSRPVVQASLALNHTLDGASVTGYHLFNLIVHLLAALALFGVVRRTLTLPALADRFGERIATALGFCVALLWALHPLQTESVTYIIQRMESLMALFYLLTLYCVIRAVTSKRPGAWHVAAVAACGLGMGCKEVMVSAPIVVLLYDRTFSAGSFRDALRRRWGLYLGLAATWFILVRSVLEAFGPHVTVAGAGFGISSVTPLLYAQSQFGVILHYLRLAFWPTGLCLDYFWPIARSAREIAPGAAVVGILLAATVWALVRRPGWGFIGALFFLVLAPTSSIMPIQDLAVEHRMYVPLAAVVAAVVVAAFLLVRRLDLGVGALLALCAAGAVALGIATYRRNADYRTTRSIYEDTVAKRPENPRAWVSLGAEKGRAGEYDEALKCFDRALKLPGDDAWAYDARGIVYQNLHRYEDALRDFNRAMALKQNFANAYNDRSNLYIAMGRFQLAVDDCDHAIGLEPYNARPYNNRGLALASLQRYEEALRDYDQALARNRNLHETYFNRALAFAALGRDELALRDYSQSIALKPQFAEGYRGRALVYDKMNRRAEALKDLDRAVALSPDSPLAHYSRALLYFEMKDYDKACADMEACEKLHGDIAPEFRRAVMQATGSSKAEPPKTAGSTPIR
jgi:tetratricopeptide (TPR) repeat protein